MKLDEINWGLVAGVGLLGMGFLSNGGINTGNSQRAELIRSQQQENGTALDAVALNEQHRKKLEAIAVQRFQDGCILVVSSNDATAAVSIVEGQPVLDWHTRQPLPNNTVVCSSSGTTAIIQNQVASLLAYTGNQEVIDAAMHRAGFVYETDSVQGGEL